MKKDELTEAQKWAYDDILALCSELGNNHWFRREERKWHSEPTLQVLENKGYLISKYVGCNQSMYYQYTGKVYEPPERCPMCKSLITKTNKMIDISECMNCKKKLAKNYAEWEKHERTSHRL